MACTSASIVALDGGDGSEVGTHNSIAIGTDGLPIISYHDETNGDLKVAHCETRTCGPWR